MSRVRKLMVGLAGIALAAAAIAWLVWSGAQVDTTGRFVVE